MTPQERQDLDLSVEAIIADEHENPRPGIHAERWVRIRELERQLKEISTANLQSSKPSKQLPPYHKTDEWNTLVRESVLLASIETRQALERDWPIWQEHQHFLYLDETNELREGEVITFDLDNNTIECTTWPRFDFHGYVNAPGARQHSTILIQQLDDAEKRLEEIESERQRLSALADLERQRATLPLLAALLT